MHTFIYILVYLQVASAVSFCNHENESELDANWELYKKMYNKIYDETLEGRRKKAWIDNCKFIREHNNQTNEYSLNDNAIADLTTIYYLREYVKLVSNRKNYSTEDDVLAAPFLQYTPLVPTPSELDWRNKGFENPNVTQKDCGSCYAFSVAGSVQGQIFKKYGKFTTLSAQQIVDCSSGMGNFGCGGGSLRNTLRYLKKSGGLMAEKDYPYVARRRKCRFDKRKIIAKISSWNVLPTKDENALKKAVASLGPIAVSINASPRTFQMYHKGVYNDSNCTSDHVNHAMLLVGYTKDAWILQNWWGPKWGENGFMRLKRNHNRCGVANLATYVYVHDL